MRYLTYFRLLDVNQEFSMKRDKKYVFNTMYPLNIFLDKGLLDIYFDDITIFYGGNGSGKSTILNIIASKLEASRKNKISLGELFDEYVYKTKYSMFNRGLKQIKYITSDDVFDYLLDVRAINSGVNRTKEDLEKEYQVRKINRPIGTRNPLEDYKELKEEVLAAKSTVSHYINSKLVNNNFETKSNGETALDFWHKEITEYSIYILDEPENSLSAENQIKLRDFILESMRFFKCQFIISTHSPFLLSIKDALIYDLDEYPVDTKKWTELKNIQIYHNFFKEYDSEFTQ